MVRFTKTIEELQNLKGDSLLRMGELAELSGVRQSTIKYYTEIGILPFNQEADGLLRRYRKDQSLKRLNEIDNLKTKKRLTIEELKEHFSK